MESFIVIGDHVYAKVQDNKYYNCAFYEGRCKKQGFIFKLVGKNANVRLKFQVPDNAFKMRYLVFDRNDCLKRFSIKGLISRSTSEPVKLDSFQVNKEVTLIIGGNKKVKVPKNSHIIITDSIMYAISDKLFNELYIRGAERNYVPSYEK